MYGVLASAVRPRPLLHVSEWADAHRVLTSKSSALAGRWKTDRTPYLREIMNDLSATSPVQRVVLKFGAQLGKTEVGLNWIGYVMSHAPGPMLVVVPTLEVRKRWKKQRLDPLLAETPILRDLLGSLRMRDASNSEDFIDFPGGVLVLAGANSPASLASMPIRYVLCDEVDRFPWEVGQEGDPLGLIEERTKTFVRRKILLVSTPTIDGASRIDAEFEASDQREYHVPCPHCGEFQVLRWQHDDGRLGLAYLEDTGQVAYVCSACGSLIDERHKTQMLERGRWVPRFPGRPVHGYSLSGLYSPLGMGFSWSEIWAQWKNSQGDSAKVKRFFNTTLGIAWREEGESLEELSLLSLRDDYPEKLPCWLARLSWTSKKIVWK
jgi:phage terminase large subunit GpA-like protein